MKGEVGEGSEENPSVLDAERGGGASSPLPLQGGKLVVELLARKLLLLPAASAVQQLCIHSLLLQLETKLGLDGSPPLLLLLV